MVSSICNGFMSSKDKKLAEKNIRKDDIVSIETEKKEDTKVSIDTIEVNELNAQKLKYSNLPSNNKEDEVVAADIIYNQEVIEGLSKVESAVKKVEKAVITSNTSKKFFKPMFSEFKKSLSNPFSSLGKNIGNYIKDSNKKAQESFNKLFNKVTSPFKNIRNFLTKPRSLPFPSLKTNGFFGGGKISPDDPIVESQQEEKKEEADILAERHKEIIDALVDIKKAIKGEDSSIGTLGIGAGIGAALAGAGKLFTKFFGGIKSGLKTMTRPLGKLKGMFGKLKDSFLRAFGKGGSVRELLGRFLKNPFGKLGALGLAGFIGSEIGKFVNDVLIPDDVKKSIGDAIGPHIDKVVSFFSGISTFFQEKFEEINPGQVWENLKKNILDSFSSISEFFENPIANLKKVFSNDEADVTAQVPGIKEPSLIGFGKDVFNRTVDSFSKSSKTTKNTPILPKRDLELYDLNIDRNIEKAEALESGITQLEATKENFFRIERQETMQNNQNKETIKMLNEQSKANSIRINTGERGRNLDNSPVVTTDLGLMMTLGGGI